MPSDSSYPPLIPKPPTNGTHSTPPLTNKQPPMVVFANAIYYGNWRYRVTGKTPASLRPEIVSHIFYSFASVEPNGQVQLSDPLTDMEAEVDGVKGCIKACTNLKRTNSNLKVILSIGGNNSPRNLMEAASQPESRHRFARSAMDLVHYFELDGIDLHGARAETETEGENYIELLHVIRQYLPAPRFILTAAMAVHSWLFRNISTRNANFYLDLFNLMCYDFASEYSIYTGHQSQLYLPDLPCADVPIHSCRSVIQSLCDEGVPTKKILLGIPLYGVFFPGTTHIGMQFERRDGMRRTKEYNQLPVANSHEEVDTSAGAAYCVGDDETGFVTYDNPTTVMMKAAFVKENKLAGLFYWEGTSDVSGVRSLISTGYSTLHEVSG